MATTYIHRYIVAWIRFFDLITAFIVCAVRVFVYVCMGVCVCCTTTAYLKMQRISHHFICTTRSFTKSLCVCPPPNSEYLQPNLIWWNFGNAHIWFIIEKLWCWHKFSCFCWRLSSSLAAATQPATQHTLVCVHVKWHGGYLTCSIFLATTRTINQQHSPDKLHIWWCRRRLINNSSFSLKNPTRSNKLFSTFYFIVYGGPRRPPIFGWKMFPIRRKFTHTHTLSVVPYVPPLVCTTFYYYLDVSTLLLRCGWLAALRRRRRRNGDDKNKVIIARNNEQSVMMILLVLFGEDDEHELRLVLTLCCVQLMQ